MTQSLGTIRRFKTRNFSVVVDALPEDDLDLSWDEDGATLRGLESGEYVAFVARVRVFLNGSEVGSDYLGGCIYRSLGEFEDHREVGRQNAKYERRERRLHLGKGEAGRCGSYFHDMIRSACAEARKTIAAQQAVRVRNVA